MKYYQNFQEQCLQKAWRRILLCKQQKIAMALHNFQNMTRPEEKKIINENNKQEKRKRLSQGQEMKQTGKQKLIHVGLSTHISHFRVNHFPNIH